MEIESVLNKEPENVCECFFDNKLIISLVKIKLNAFFSLLEKPTGVQHKTCDSNRVKQLDIVEYLGCGLDANLSGESMEIKSLKKINTKLQFLFRKK